MSIRPNHVSLIREVCTWVAFMFFAIYSIDVRLGHQEWFLRPKLHVSWHWYCKWVLRFQNMVWPSQQIIFPHSCLTQAMWHLVTSVKHHRILLDKRFIIMMWSIQLHLGKKWLMETSWNSGCFAWSIQHSRRIFFLPRLKCAIFSWLRGWGWDGMAEELLGQHTLA